MDEDSLLLNSYDLRKDEAIMEFIADLHLHSHFSRATARDLDLEHLYLAAQLKGISLVGTGDFTHPGWLKELEEKLIPAEDGLFRLDPLIATALDKKIPSACRGKVRFILQAEISSIYKKDDRVRKNHNLVYCPDFNTVKQLNRILSSIGNLTSDGRPILGLDAQKLLEIVLETSISAFLVPAHIWTPWFSMFGSKSGFDSIEECFGRLSSHIFAVETGLSSNPPMNWRVENLDHVTLIANSDAHSPMFLGRNASVFKTDLSYFTIRHALETGDINTFQGTIDMYPEEGKYHYDGHRNCNICLNPAQTLANSNLCPECKKPLTLGVLYRVNQLASRPEGFIPDGRHGYRNIIPLTDILSEILDVGPKTKKVTQCYARIVEALGPELDVLIKTPVETIKTAGIPLLDEAIGRMRQGNIDIAPGFDGEFGKVKIFSPDEKRALKGEKELFIVPARSTHEKTNSSKGAHPRTFKRQGQSKTAEMDNTKQHPISGKNKDHPLSPGLNPEQQEAVESVGRPLLIEAGPGTGKTMTLSSKIAFLIDKKKVRPESILALTFTNQAAQEMKQRIQRMVPGTQTQVCAMTFHSFCLMLLKEYTQFNASLIDDAGRKPLLQEALAHEKTADHTLQISFKQLNDLILLAKQQCLGPADNLEEISGKKFSSSLSRVWNRYQHYLSLQNLIDFEDLIAKVCRLLDQDQTLVVKLQERFLYLFVDEYQDINQGQYRLTRNLAGSGERLFVIGDPDQSIYGFRGSDNRYFKRFMDDYPNAVKIILTRNYRSTRTILEASHQLITKQSATTEKEKLISNITGKNRLIIQEAATDLAEAVAVGKQIEALTGGISHFSMDTGKAQGNLDREFSFSDFAVLYRTKKQSQCFAKVFEKAGIPFQTADKDRFFNLPGIREMLALGRLILGMGTFLDLETGLGCFCTKVGAKSYQNLRSWFFNLETNPEDALTKLSHGSGPKLRKNIQNPLILAAKEIEILKNRLSVLSPADYLKALAALEPVTEILEKHPSSKESLEQLDCMAERFKGPAKDFLESLTLTRDSESLIPDAQKVSLLTLHAAKGLEFPVVFITGCETGLIPYAHRGHPVQDMEEERRLFYVAMTRAKDILYLTYAKKRRIYNRMTMVEKSLFLSDIEEKLKEYSKTKGKPAALKKTKSIQLDLFTD